jgi:CRISPR-associated protein Cas1
MGTIYITSEDAFIGKADERITVKVEQKVVKEIPMINTDGIVVLGRATVSPAVVMELLQRHIPLTYLTAHGKYLGCLMPEMTKNLFVRKAQWGAIDSSPRAIHLVQGFVRGKLKNYRSMLQRRLRDYPDLPLDDGVKRLEQAIAPIDKTDQIDSLRGLEGAGSAAYFGCFNELIRNDNFSFAKRVRRPPTDPINSLLSLGYALLRHDVQSALNIVGFDPYLGYLHTERYGRPSLALDLMEEFRPLVVDRLVLTIINKNQLLPNHFETEPLSGAVSLTKDGGLQLFLRAYEEHKLSEFKHPVLGKKCTYHEAFEIQARLMAKYLMGEVDKYPPLVLK